jgi:hypothetical protein
MFHALNPRFLFFFDNWGSKYKKISIISIIIYFINKKY